MNLTFECPIHFKRRAAARKSLRGGPAPEPTPLPEGTVPRISRLMALAIHFDRLLATGAVGSLAELARRFRVTRARITQIMALNRLAPDLQERLLFLPRTVSGRAGITERDLRAVAAEADWGEAEGSITCHANLPSMNIRRRVPPRRSIPLGILPFNPRVRALLNRQPPGATRPTLQPCFTHTAFPSLRT